MSQLIDEALSASGLKIYSDPRAQEGLVVDIVEAARPVRIINEYEYGVERVRCAICPKHQHHHRGITVEFDDGSKALCGSVCAEKLYGKDVWNRIQNEFSDRRTVELQASLIDPTRELVDRAREKLAPMFTMFQHGEAFAIWLRSNDPVAYGSLKSTVKTGARALSISETRQEFPLFGGQFLLAIEKKLHSALGGILRDLEEALMEGTSRTSLLKISRLRSDLRSTLSEFLDSCSALKAFLNDRMLISISGWANQLRSDGPYHFFAKADGYYGIKGEGVGQQTFRIRKDVTSTEVIELSALWD